MPSPSSSKYRLVKLEAFLITLALLMLMNITLVQGKRTLLDGTHYYAIGYWYSETNIKNQTLGMSGMIEVYDNKIKGTGKYIVEFVQILFSDGSWMQIGYQKKSTGERVYYYEYFIYLTGNWSKIVPFGNAPAGAVSTFMVYRVGSSNNGWRWRAVKDGNTIIETIFPSKYSLGRAEAALESLDANEEITYNDGRGRFTSLKYYDGITWKNWNAIKFTNGSGKSGAEYPPDPPYHAEPLDTNAFKTWGDYDADP
ncbi:MAG: hypothetical protein QXI36_03565 [Candidatus Bathyarchaeia archaeon]